MVSYSYIIALKVFSPKRHWTFEFPNSHTKQWSVLPAAALCTSSWPASLSKPHGIPVPHGKPSQLITTNCHWHSGSPVSEQDGIDPIESRHGRTTVLLKIPDNWHFVDLSRWIVNSTVPQLKNATVCQIVPTLLTSKQPVLLINLHCNLLQKCAIQKKLQKRTTCQLTKKWQAMMLYDSRVLSWPPLLEEPNGGRCWYPEKGKSLGLPPGGDVLLQNVAPFNLHLTCPVRN